MARPVYYELAESRAGRGSGAAGPVERRRLLRDGRHAMSLADDAARGARARPSPARRYCSEGDPLDPHLADGSITPAAVLVAIVDRPEPTRDPDRAPRYGAPACRPDRLPGRPHRSRRRRPDRRGFARGRGGDRPAARLRRSDRHRRPLPHDHRLRGHAGGRRCPAGPAARRPIPARSPACSRRRSTIFCIPSTRSSAPSMWRGSERAYYEIEWQGRRIWGATAAMIVNLSRRLALVS